VLDDEGGLQDHVDDAVAEAADFFRELAIAAPGEAAGVSLHALDAGVELVMTQEEDALQQRGIMNGDGVAGEFKDIFRGELDGVRVGVAV
jgi:hypothetical protein